MKVFVGCSSRDEIDSTYFALAKSVGRCLTDYELVLGGTCVGMMGAIAHTFPNHALSQIILKDYLDEGVEKTKQLMICDTSFERMNLIWEHSDVFLFLPGGIGTLGEMITFLEENRMKQEKKKIIIFNYHHYYDSIFSFFEKVKNDKFSSEEILEGIIWIENIKELEKLL